MEITAAFGVADGRIGLSDAGVMRVEPPIFTCGCMGCAAGIAPAPLGAGPDVARYADPAGSQPLDALIAGTRWAGSVVSYGVPASAAEYESNSPERLSNFEQVGGAQLRAIHATLGDPARLDTDAPRGFSVAGFSDLAFRFDAVNAGDATLRFANTSNPATAYAYYPDSQAFGGDVFFGPSGRKPLLGNYDYFTIIHEIGHALGLKHGHETYPNGALPKAQDSMEFSVMTYRSFVGSDARFVYNETYGYAQTFMMLDIAALQHLYGANYDVNSGDTVYSWRPGSGQTYVDGAAALNPGANRIFATIWDGGGADTYDLSAYASGVSVDLAPGGYSTFAAAQRAWLGGGPNDGHARGNLFNALQHRGDARSLIENAIGGAGDDILRGNAAANVLKGNDGADILRGLDGDDLLVGGFGNDTLEGGAGDDTLEGGGDTDRLDGGTGSDTAIYASIDSAVRLDLAAGRVTYPEKKWAVETLISIENGVTGPGRDMLIGSGATNRLAAGAGNDTIIGAGGADTLIGGAGRDIFVFLKTSESTTGNRDRLVAGDGGAAFDRPGSAAGDRFDLSGIDAVSGGGDNAFKWGGFSVMTKGYVWVQSVGSETRIRANTDNDTAFEFEVAILDGGISHRAYSAADFIL